MLKSTLLEALYGIWPMVVIFTVILSSLRITYFIYNKRERFVLYKEVFSLLFIIYILILFYIVTFQDNNYGFSNLIPFKEIFRYEFGTRLFYKNIVGNILLFLPFGLFISSYINTKKVFPILILTLVSSLSIELTQRAIGRVFDIDDIILNIIGGLLGYYIYKFLNSIRRKLPSIFKKVWFINLIMITIILLILFYSTNWYTYIFDLVT